jgi:hypothetical protein
LKIEIDSKYGIGNIVQKYRTIRECQDRIVCPLCNGRHFVDNPKYDPYDDDEYEKSRLECPHCNEDGYIETNYVTKRVLDQEIYRIESIYASIRKDGSVQYTYSIQSTPELNNRDCMYCSCNAYEEELELLRMH